MLTRPLNDFRCLLLVLHAVRERLHDPAVQTMARE